MSLIATTDGFFVPDFQPLRIAPKFKAKAPKPGIITIL